MSDTLIFLDIQAIKGESTTKNYVDLIELESISWSTSAEVAKTQSSNSSKLNIELKPERMTVVKYFDRASSNLCNYMSQRKLISEAKLTFARLLILPDGQHALPVMEIFLDDGYVEDVKLQASESGLSMAVKETVQLSFRKMELVYYPVDVRTTGKGKAHTFSCEQPLQAE